MTSLIAQFGALGVFVLMVPESACIPIPSELTLLCSGYAVDSGLDLVPARRRWPRPPATSRVAARLRPRRQRAARPGARLRGVLARWESMLDRRGTRAVLIARLLPLARTFVSLPAGARRIPLAGSSC